MIRLLEPLPPKDTWVHRQSARNKLLLALAGIAGCVVAPFTFWPVPVLWTVVLTGWLWIGRVPFSFLLKRLLLWEPLVLGMAILAWFQPGGGLIFLRLLVKSTLSLATMILLSNTTSFSDILRVLQRWHVPELLVTTLALMYRYLFVLVDEAERMRRARASRTFSKQHTRNWKSLASIIGVLFVRASERAERIYAAMCARGWK